MYLEYFGLQYHPFRITPDPSMFWPGGGRGEVLETLIYAITTGEGIIKALGLIMCDLDYFKRVNDTSGHIAGDLVLKETSKVIRQSIRDSDIVSLSAERSFWRCCPMWARGRA